MMGSPVLSDDQKRELKELKSKADGYLSQCVMWRLAHYTLGMAAAACSIIVATRSVVVHHSPDERYLSAVKVSLSLLAAVAAGLITFLKPVEKGTGHPSPRSGSYALGLAAIACSIAVAVMPPVLAVVAPEEQRLGSMRVSLSLAAAVFVGIITFLKPKEKASEYLNAWRTLHDAHIDCSLNPTSISNIAEAKETAASIIERIHSRWPYHRTWASVVGPSVPGEPDSRETPV